MKIKVVSFNMKRSSRFSKSNTWMERIGAIRAFFRREKPDIVGTQELTAQTLARLEEILPAYAYIGQGREGGAEGEYTAILYRKDRFRLLEYDMFWLSRTPDKAGSRSWFSFFPRTCTWALLESLIDGSRVRVYNTHLDHISAWARAKGLALIEAHMQKSACPDESIILTGDFNASPDSGALRIMRRRGHASLGGASRGLWDVAAPGRTYHGFRGKVKGQPIDYIFTSGSMDVLTGYINRSSYLGRYPSDHYPIVMIAHTQQA